jgi:hypothetical protein
MESLGDGRSVGSFWAGRVNTSTSSKPAASRKRESADLSAPGGERNGIRATPGQSLGHQVSPRSKGECRGAKPLCRGPRGVPLIPNTALGWVGRTTPMLRRQRRRRPRAHGVESAPDQPPRTMSGQSDLPAGRQSFNPQDRFNSLSPPIVNQSSHLRGFSRGRRASSATGRR